MARVRQTCQHTSFSIMTRSQVLVIVVLFQTLFFSCIAAISPDRLPVPGCASLDSPSREPWTNTSYFFPSTDYDPDWAVIIFDATNGNVSYNNVNINNLFFFFQFTPIKLLLLWKAVSTPQEIPQ